MTVKRSSLLWGTAAVIVAVLAAVAQTQSTGGAGGAGQGAKPAEKPAAGKPPGGAPGGKAPPPPLVTVEPAVRQDVSGMHTFVGTVMPIKISSIGSAVDGRVVEFPKNEGDRVEAGETLCQLLTGQLDIQLAGAKAELKLREHELAELKASWPREVEQARARYMARKAALDYANARLKRTRSLFERNTVTADQVEEAVSLAEQASQSYAEAESALAITEGPRKLAIDQAEQRVAVQEEAANAIQDQINKHTIRTPFNGYVVEEFTEVGQWVAKAGLVAKVAQLDEVDVEIGVLETYLPHLYVGMPATLEIPALRREPFTGQVAIIVPQADVRSRNFPVKVRVQNRIGDAGQPEIKAGMLARVQLEVASVAGAVLVHKDAVVLGGPSPVVYVVETASASSPPAASGQGRIGTIRQVKVQLGLESGNHIAVTGEVKPGDLVVVMGNERLRPQMPVTIGVQRPAATFPSSSE